MKREDLKAKGLTDEQIDFVMAENGKDIESHKTSLATVQKELETAQSQLTEANKQIEGFKGMDIDGIKKAADDYKAQYEQAKQDAETQVQKLKFDHALDDALAEAKAKNAKAVKALLDTDGLELLKDGTLNGLDKQLEKIKSENEYLFESTEETPKIVAGGNNNSIKIDSFEAAARRGAGLPLMEGK